MNRIMDRIYFAFLAAAILSVMTPPARAQQSAETPVFRLQVRSVPEDVVVLDKNGKPVRGLKRDDFIVKEDGKTQHIVSFDSFDGSSVAFTPPQLPAPPPNTFRNVPSAPERGPLYILYYDMVDTPPGDQMTFRKELLKFIDEAQPGTRIALFVNADGLHLLQGFTTDHPLLREAALRKGPGPHMPQVFIYGETFGANDVGGCLSNLRFISEYLNGIPGRKNLLWLASNFPIPVTASMTGRSTVTASAAPQMYSVGSQGGPQVLDLTDLERENVQRTYAAMMRSQIALYPVDLRGIAGGTALGGTADLITDHQKMDMIAAGTGGHAMYGNNRVDSLLNEAVEHGESYYTMVYDPANQKYDGSERHIQITLAKKNDYTVTYRQVYFAVSDKDEDKQKQKDPLQARFLAAKQQDNLYANIEHGAPMLHDLLFSAHVAAAGEPELATAEQMQTLEDSPEYFKTRRRHKAAQPLKPVKLQKYVIDYGVIDPQLKAAAEHNQTATLEFAAAAYNDDGRLLNSMLNRGVPSGAKGSAKQAALFHAVQELDAPPGAAFIRLAVRDVLTNRTGTLEMRLPLQPETNSAQTAPQGSAPGQ
ncbi:MAG TPA: VWA domain-containing protein [Terracidiphilus sp.]|jgi:VWFA-related protein